MDNELREMLLGKLRYKPRRLIQIGVRNGEKLYIVRPSKTVFLKRFQPKKHWYDALFPIFKPRYKTEPLFTDILDLPFRWFDRERK